VNEWLISFLDCSLNDSRVAQIFNGITLVPSRLNSTTTYGGSPVASFLTLANDLNDPRYCLMGQVNSLPYKDDMNDFRLYNQELAASDVCTLNIN